MTNKQVYERVTKKIIELIESKKKLIWSKSWTGHGVLPRNFVTGTIYRGFNRMICSFFDKPHFMTFNEIRKKGGKLKKKSKSIPIVYWNFLFLDENGKKTKNEDEAVKKIPFLRYFNVFNEEDIEGIDFPDLGVERMEDFEKIEACETIVAKHSDLKLVHRDSSGAYYMPRTDTINVPEPDTFKTTEFYYSVLFHEMAHWTGHNKRLGRLDVDNLSPFGSPDYSEEELVAEMTASFLCDYTQIENEQTLYNSAAYLKGWLKKLKSDPKMLISSATKAQRAFEFITKTNKGKNESTGNA